MYILNMVGLDEVFHQQLPVSRHFTKFQSCHGLELFGFEPNQLTFEWLDKIIERFGLAIQIHEYPVMKRMALNLVEPMIRKIKSIGQTCFPTAKVWGEAKLSTKIIRPSMIRARYQRIAMPSLIYQLEITMPAHVVKCANFVCFTAYQKYRLACHGQWLHVAHFSQLMRKPDK